MLHFFLLTFNEPFCLLFLHNDGNLNDELTVILNLHPLYLNLTIEDLKNPQTMSNFCFLATQGRNFLITLSESSIQFWAVNHPVRAAVTFFFFFPPRVVSISFLK